MSEPVATVAAMPTAASLVAPQQLRLDELDQALRATTFVVVDLETTGGSAASEVITEIGAVKVRGGEVLGEFATLVDPGRAIPPLITVLTGITQSMVTTAPAINSVLPSFLEFATGAVLVAHNATFDVSFLKAASHVCGLAWPAFAVVDTALLARRVLSRDEVPNCKLATLSSFFAAATTPTHRALVDARATVDVLHGLLGRLGSMGVHSLPELRAFTARVSDAQRRKRHLANNLPRRPGVYVFRDVDGVALYVGTSQDIGARVRQYFMSTETRSRMAEMVALADQVEAVVCAHPLEAHVRELRLIAAHKPRYNRRSKFPERAMWLKLTDEPFPRLSVVRSRRADAGWYLGPLANIHEAQAVRDAIHHAVPLRECTQRLSARRPTGSACALAGIGRCLAPCEHPVVTEYGELVTQVAAAWCHDPRPLVGPLQRRMAVLGATERFEQAAVIRDRLTVLVRACARAQQLQSLYHIAELVAAAPDGRGGWNIAIVRHGRLAGAAHAPRATPPYPVIDAAVMCAEVVPEPPWAQQPDATPRADRSRPVPAGTDTATTAVSTAATAEETWLILRWLASPGVRLVRTSSAWSSPAFGATGLHAQLGGGTGRLPPRPTRRAGRRTQHRLSALPSRHDHRDRDGVGAS